MGALYHNGHFYGGGQDIDIQSDPTATSLNAGEVPTGDTIESVLNTNYIKSKICTGKVTLPTLPSGNAGYRIGVTSGHGGASVVLANITGYPNDKTILAVIPYDCTRTSANYIKGYLYLSGTNMGVYGDPGQEYSYSICVLYLE